MVKWLRADAALPGLISSTHLAAQGCKFLEFHGICHPSLTCERTRHTYVSHTHMQSKYPTHTIKQNSHQKLSEKPQQ